MAFSDPVRPGVTPCCIPLVQNSHCPGPKKSLKKNNSLGNQIPSTRSSDEVPDGHVFRDRSGTQISIKIHCDFHQNIGFWSSLEIISSANPLLSPRSGTFNQWPRNRSMEFEISLLEAFIMAFRDLVRPSADA